MVMLIVGDKTSTTLIAKTLKTQKKLKWSNDSWPCFRDDAIIRYT